MGIFENLGKSADLVMGMAERLGMEMVETVTNSPEIEGLKFRQRVFLCSSCADQDACEELQANNRHLDEAPEYCVNKQALEHGARQY